MVSTSSCIRDATYTNLKLFKEWSLLLHGTRDAPYTNLPVTDPHSKVSFFYLWIKGVFKRILIFFMYDVKTAKYSIHLFICLVGGVEESPWG